MSLRSRAPQRTGRAAEGLWQSGRIRPPYGAGCIALVEITTAYAMGFILSPLRGWEPAGQFGRQHWQA
jgi:hypothetical protein